MGKLYRGDSACGKKNHKFILWCSSRNTLFLAKLFKIYLPLCNKAQKTLPRSLITENAWNYISSGLSTWIRLIKQAFIEFLSYLYVSDTFLRAENEKI